MSFTFIPLLSRSCFFILSLLVWTELHLLDVLELFKRRTYFENLMYLIKHFLRNAENVSFTVGSIKILLYLIPTCDSVAVCEGHRELVCCS